MKTRIQTSVARPIATMALAFAVALPGMAASQTKISKPGEYAGYSKAVYDGYQLTSFYIEVRDGTRLAVDLYRPTRKGVVASEKLPVVWMNTPYNRRKYRGRDHAAEDYPGYGLKLAPYGYVVAVVDFRGLYGSYGTNTSYTSGEWVDAARYDAYDVTEWFAKQPYSTGKIGMWGCSATGASQLQSLSVRPPSLRAVIPMSADIDAYMLWATGGIYRQIPAPAPNAAAQPDALSAVAKRDKEAFPVNVSDGAALLAEALAEHANNIESVGEIPFRDSVSPTTGLSWWLKSSPYTYLNEMKKADMGVMSVANWNEPATRHGPFFTFNNLNPAHTKLLVGPATHCSWGDVKKDTGFDLVTEELRFFDYWLKGIKNNVMTEPGVTYYTYNASKESSWRSSASWPLKNEKRTNFYLADNALDTTRPASTVEQAYPIKKVVVANAGPGDNSGNSPLPEGAVFETKALTADLQITGHPVIHVWLKTAAGDVDVNARIDDIAPDGTNRSYQMTGALRASHRKLGKAPFNYLGLPWMNHTQADVLPVPKDEPVELQFEMLPMSYIFKAGNKLRLTLSFSPSSGRLEEGATVTVVNAPEQASFITLPVIPQ